MKIVQTNYTGRKARVGNICFDNRDRMCVFVNYCPGCRGKVVMTLDEAKHFANRYKYEEEKLSSKILDYFRRRRYLS